jgi:biopolymer transport protein ExbB/TolQ
VSSHDIDQAIFHIASALEVPVLILALLALATVIYEAGSFAVEVYGRHRRRFSALTGATAVARDAILSGDRHAAARAVDSVAKSAAMGKTLSLIIQNVGTEGGEHRVNKALADFDFDAQRRLSRTRLLVRAGPALGLMGTLIPLSPALTGLANGNTAALSHNLRIAFSVTVVGLLIGAVAFGLSLSRDRMYGQDLSDLQYVAAVLSDPAPGGSTSADGAQGSGGAERATPASPAAGHASPAPPGAGATPPPRAATHPQPTGGTP